MREIPNKGVKMILIQVIAILIVCGFLAYSTNVSPDQINGNAIMSGGNRITPLIHINSSSDSGHVKYTLFLFDNILIEGNKIKGENDLGPSGITYDSWNGDMYVIDRSSNLISVIDSSSNSVISTIKLETYPVSEAFDARNGYIYVATPLSNNICVINGETNSIVSKIKVRAFPEGVVFDSLNGNIYVTKLASNNVSVIDGATNSVVSKIKTGDRPCGITFDSSNGYLYLTSQREQSVSVINGGNNSLVSRISVGFFPDEATFDPLNGYIYVTGFSSICSNALGNFRSSNQSNPIELCYNKVSVINGANNKMVSTISVGSSESKGLNYYLQHLFQEWIVFDPLNRYLYMTDSFSNNVSVINGANNKLVSTISVGSDPVGAVFDPLNGYVYVTNYKSGSVSIISTGNSTLISKNNAISFGIYSVEIYAIISSTVVITGIWSVLKIMNKKKLS
ncbi:YncE family protein [Cuniculiplasma sp. SKW4]|uniref:YncE family protein n=1 Tax=Cuniculiplasma sp. SKW4 TaxID=3400171 RepID=UPI003FD61FBF